VNTAYKPNASTHAFEDHVNDQPVGATGFLRNELVNISEIRLTIVHFLSLRRLARIGR
jgi:hypothetical protein